MALVLGMITANTGCVYQAELTEFLDDPTGMKAEAEMTAEMTAYFSGYAPLKVSSESFEFNDDGRGNAQSFEQSDKSWL